MKTDQQDTKPPAPDGMIELKGGESLPVLKNGELVGIATCRACASKPIWMPGSPM